jgi:pyruvate,water dikinase
MTLTQVWGSLLIFIVCPLVGGLPLAGWITRLSSGQRLAELGTGNISVSAAFYHGGTIAGLLTVLAEAGKGIFAVLLARTFFANDSTWELIALIALVIGRYWISRGAGTTNVAWGCVVYDWTVALLVFLIGGISFTILRERQQGRIGVLILFPLIVALKRQDPAETVAAIALSSLLGWIYQKIPDDLDLATNTAQTDSQRMFKFFRGDRANLDLNKPLAANKVGRKAATLSQLKRWGYAVPRGWVLPAGDDPEPLIESLQPSPEAPLVVRSSAVGEDLEQASAAGQYRTILHVTSRSALMDAIAECQGFYNQLTAVQYRQDRGLTEEGMAVLVQVQVKGVFSGVAFSRDPLQGAENAVAIEGLPGEASRVVSGQFTPERYRVLFPDNLTPTEGVGVPDLEIEGNVGDLPPQLIRQVALLARDLEARYHGIPQDIEWSYDGRTLWLLQSRPITTLFPIWTRKIAAEVIPGVIRPLTWSINQPLTCGVWGNLFTLVLGQRSQGLDFRETATLHHARAYFNASLLGQIFRRMGLPAESLEFLIRGAPMSKPSLRSMLKNTPGLLRLGGRELSLARDFDQDHREIFTPLLAALTHQPAANLTPPELLARINQILTALKSATYYSILAPLSASLRQALLKVEDTQIDTSQTPETASLRALQAIADASRKLFDNLDQLPTQSSLLFATLADLPHGQRVLQQLDRFLERYGYLSEVATDIAVPTWKEDPQPIREVFTRFLFNPPSLLPKLNRFRSSGWRGKQVQARVNLKGQVSAIYSQLLAELRWSFVALEQVWLQSGLLNQSGDIFFLEFREICQLIEQADPALIRQISQLIDARRSQLAQDSELKTVPTVVYGNLPPAFNLNLSNWQPSEQIQGIGASPGRVEGRVKVLRHLQTFPDIDSETILVVPYTDAGWAPLLAHAGGLISEVGGRLSHGAIVAREYGIPAVMDVANATQRLQDGQQVRIDGQQGIVEIL